MKIKNIFGFNRQKKKETIVGSFSKKTNWNVRQDYDFTKPLVQGFYSSKYIAFGEDNLYPQALLGMYASSPFHSSIIEFKKKSVLQDGYDLTSKNDSLENAILLKKTQKKMDSMINRIVLEHIIHSRVYIKVIKTGNLLDYSICAAEQVRKSVEADYFEVNENWELSQFDSVKIPKWNKYKKEDGTYLIEIQDLRPGDSYYATPFYISAANWIWLDGEIAFFQKQSIENSVNPSVIMKFFQRGEDEKADKAFINSVQDNFAGARNAGKVLVFLSDGKELSPEIVMAEPNKLDESFAVSQENIIKNVGYSHLINPIIMGVATAGKLGTTTEIEDAFNIFKKMYLNTEKSYISKVVNNVFEELNIDLEFHIK